MNSEFRELPTILNNCQVEYLVVGGYAFTGLEFAPAAARCKLVEMDGLTVPLVSLADLILAKRTAGRPQDLLDLASLVPIDL